MVLRAKYTSGQLAVVIRHATVISFVFVCGMCGLRSLVNFTVCMCMVPVTVEGVAYWPPCVQSALFSAKIHYAHKDLM